MRHILSFLGLFIITIHFSMAQNSEVLQLIESVRMKYAPDKRTEVFEIDFEMDEGVLTLKGATTHPKAKEELLRGLKSLSPSIKDSIRLLPAEELEDKTWGIVYNSMGTIHTSNAYSSETASQVLLGTPVRILDKVGGWRRIQTPDHYIGWMNGAVHSVTEKQLRDYNHSPKIIITTPYTHSFADASTRTEFVSDLVEGNTLLLRGEKKDFYRVEYPNGRAAYVRKSDARKMEEWRNSIRLTGESIVAKAKQMAGVPYVWGGTSSKGLDCSGLTKYIHLLHGVILQRDASQQVLYGKLVDEKGTFEDAQPGDLVFFGVKASEENPKERVVHVGIYIGNKRFIHASDYIRVNSFDPTDELYDEYNTNRYLRTKRVLGEVGTSGIDSLFENEFYK